MRFFLAIRSFFLILLGKPLPPEILPPKELAAPVKKEEPAPEAPIDEIAHAVLTKFSGSVFHDSHGQPVVYVERDVWHDVAAFLRDEEKFTQCIDVTVVDHLADEERLVVTGVTPERFEIVANYLSQPRNRRIRTICEVSADDPTLAQRTWVLLTESPEGGWGVDGPANTGADLAAAARAELTALAAKKSA